MSEPNTAPAVVDLSDSQISALAAMLRQHIGEPVPVPKPAKPKSPMISPALRASIASTCALWPLFALNAVLLWLLMTVPDTASYALYLERVVRILQLSAIALVFDVWLHPGQHPAQLDGPAQGARQYQRIYTVGIFVLAGCLAP